jgi:hypothetical protein
MSQEMVEMQITEKENKDIFIFQLGIQCTQNKTTGEVPTAFDLSSNHTSTTSPLKYSANNNCSDFNTLTFGSSWANGVVNERRVRTIYISVSKHEHFKMQ